MPAASPPPRTTNRSVLSDLLFMPEMLTYPVAVGPQPPLVSFTSGDLIACAVSAARPVAALVSLFVTEVVPAELVGRESAMCVLFGAEVVAYAGAAW